MKKEKEKNLLQEMIMLIPNLIKLLYRMIRDNRVRLQEKAILLGTIIYVISPLDFVPDFIPFVGQVDDILLISLILLRFLEQAGSNVVLEHWNGRQSLLETFLNSLRLSRLFLPSRVYDAIVKQSGYRGDYIDVKYRIHEE